MIARRTFLKFAGIGTAGASLPTWISRAFAQDEEAPRNALQKAVERARRLGKPLLVFIIPEDSDSGAECYIRGETLGLLLEHGGDVLYSNLALCEVACLPHALVKELAPKHKGKPTPVALLMDTREFPLLPVRIDAKHEPMPSMDWEEAEKFEEPLDEVTRRYKEWIVRIAKTFSDAIAPDAEGLRRHARQANMRLGGKHSAVVLHQLGRSDAKPLGRLDLAEIDRAAALVRHHAESSKEAGKTWLPLLASAARERLWKKPIPGARWATTDGCAVEFEDGNQDWAIDCGMGFVADTSRRFLWLYTEEETAK